MTAKRIEINVFTYKNLKRLCLALLESGYTVRIKNATDAGMITVEILDVPTFTDLKSTDETIL